MNQEKNDIQIDLTPRLGRYQLKKLLGQGGMGKVYEAYDPSLKRDVALKTALESDNVELHKRFIQEASAMARLSHPNIVRLYDIGNQGEIYYFTMDLIDGQTISKTIKEGKLPLRRSVEIVYKVALALDYAHKEGILHRDIKPDNIIITGQGEPIIMDFGLAVEVNKESRLSRSGAILGTPAYMSPEQALGHRREIDERSDVYSLGAVFYEMLTGKSPFRGTNSFAILTQITSKNPTMPSKLSAKIPLELSNICLKAMEKEKKLRYQSALEFAQDLNRFLNGEPVLAVRPSWRYTLGKWIVKNRSLITSVSILIIGVILIVYSQLKTEIKQEITKKALQTRQYNKEEIANRLVLTQLNMAEQQEWDGHYQTSALIHAHLIENGEREGACPDLMRLARLRIAAQFPKLLHKKRALSGHRAKINSIRFSPDGKLLASGSDDKTVQIWNLMTGEKNAQIDEDSEVYAVAFSPSGEMLAYSTEQGVVCLWSTNDARHVAKMVDAKTAGYSLVFNEDGSLLFSGHQDQNIYEWNVSQKVLKSTIPTEHGWVRALAIYRNDLASAGNDCGIVVNCANPKSLDGHSDIVVSLDFSPDGKILASASHDRTIRLWDVEEEITSHILYGHVDRALDVAFHPNGTTLASIGVGNNVMIWDTDTGGCLYVLERLGGNSAIAFSPDGKTFAVSQMNYTIQLWQYNIPSPRILEESPDVARSLAISSDGGTIACGRRNHGIDIWKLSSGVNIRHLNTPGMGWIQFLSFSPDSKIIFASDKHILSSWDISTGISKMYRPINSGTSHAGVVISPDGTMYAYATYEPNKKCSEIVITTALRNEQIKFQMDSPQINSIVFSPNSDLLACGGANRKLSLYDMRNKNLKYNLVGHTQCVLALAFSPDGKILASVGAERTVRLWDTASGKFLRFVQTKLRPITNMVFSPDGETLAMIGNEAIWFAKLDISNVYTMVKVPLNAVTCLAFSPNQKIFAYGSTSHTIKIMNIPEIEHSFLNIPASEIRQKVEQATNSRLLMQEEDFSLLSLDEYILIQNQR